MPRVTMDDHDRVVDEYLRILRRRKWLIFALVAGTVAAALGWSLSQEKVYSAEAEVLLQPRSNENLFNALGEIRDPGRLAQTQMKVIQSRPVRDLVAAALGSAPPVATSQSGITDIIEIRAKDVDPRRAAAIANGYAEAYIEFRRTRAIDDLLAASTQIQARIDALQEEIDALAGQAPATEGAAANPVVSSQLQALTNQQSTFKEKLNQLEVDSALATGGAELVNPAVVPRSPVEPSPVSDAVTAAVVGLILAVALSFLLEYLDDSITTKEHLERAIGPGVPTLGLIPVIESADLDRAGHGLVVSASSRPAEAFRGLRTSIQFQGLESPVMLQVTSPTLAEGKTTTASNLAMVMATAGMRVVVVDCDLRRPRIHKMFGLPAAPGFTSVVVGDTPVPAALHPVAHTGHLRVLTAGVIPPNPSEILSHARCKAVLESLAKDADIVLIDSPPLLPVSDASALAGQVSGILLVAAAGVTRRRHIHRAVELLTQVHAPLVGTVLTGVKLDRDDDYGYYRSEGSVTPGGLGQAPPPARSTNGGSRKRSSGSPMSSGGRARGGN